jgi:hypothetical protein
MLYITTDTNDIVNIPIECDIWYDIKYNKQDQQGKVAFNERETVILLAFVNRYNNICLEQSFDTNYVLL